MNIVDYFVLRFAAGGFIAGAIVTSTIFLWTAPNKELIEIANRNLERLVEKQHIEPRAGPLGRCRDRL
ncbi:MAG: hypothetical protein ACREUY_03185 [Burkholderiales bacterium]